VSEIYTWALGRLDGGLVLDVATGEGGYAGLLAAHLKSYRQIIGIDTSTPALLAARDNENLREHTFVRVDAGRLAFCNATFDTTAMAFSCHHLARPARVLLEMVRVLRPGGHLVIVEMHASARTKPQRTVVQVHHWAAAVDSALGSTHAPTFPRQRFVDWIEALPLDEIEFHDHCASGANPFDPQFTSQVQRYIDTYLERASGTSDYPRFARQAAELHAQLSEGGAQPEPILVMIARKRT